MIALAKNQFRGWEITLLISLFLGSIAFSLLWVHGATEDGFRLLLKATARISFPLFMMSALASSLYKLAPNGLTRWLLTNRRFTGISFAIAYLYHLFGVTGLFWTTGHVGIDGLELALSIICYAFLAAMTVTSFNFLRHKMSPWAWDGLHGIGMLFFWYFFIQEYVHLAEDGNTLYIPLAIVTASVLPIKVIALAKTAKKPS
jgi:methionine sulfoxide reductase heme-binding subunit